MGKHSRPVFVGLLSTAFILAGCSSGGSGRPAPQAAMFSVGGTVSGLAGSAVVLRNGTTDITVNTNSTFAFAGALANGTTYNVTVATQPSNPPQNCAVTNGSGTVNGANVTNISVTCTTALSVASSTPANGATNHARTSNIVVTFSAPLDAAKVAASQITLSDATGPHDIQLAVAGEQLRVTPNSRLHADTRYTLHIPADVGGINGEALAAAVNLSFDTAPRSWRTEAVIPGLSDELKVSAFHARAPNGDLLLAWTDQRLLPADVGNPERLVSSHWLARYSAVSGWSTQQLGTSTWANPDPGANTRSLIRIGVARNGEIFVTHLTGDHAQIMVHRFTPDNGWADATTIDSATPGALEDHAVAADNDGNAIAVWMRSDGTRVNAWAANFSNNGSWSAPRQLDVSAAGDSQDPQVAFDAAGNAHVIWHRFDPADSTMQNQDIWAVHYQRSGGWGVADDIAPATVSDASPALQVDDAGNAVVIYDQGREPSDLSISARVWSVRYTAAGWAAAAPIPSAMPFANRPELSLNATLNGFAVWEQSVGGDLAVQTARHSAANGWTLGPVISDAGQGSVDSPTVAVDQSGDNAMAVWCQESGGISNTWAARFEDGSWQDAQLIEQTSPAIRCQAVVALDEGGDATAVWFLTDASDNISFMFNRYE
jgi:hypothetical protein